MPTTRRRLDSWPTPQQESLLLAALSDGPRAVRAWEEWKLQARIDRLDPSSRRLLPLLYRNLRRQEIAEPGLKGYRDQYLRAWRDNHLFFHRIARLLQSFQHACVPTMVLKGAALAVLYYRDCGLRPMDDVDLLVRDEHRAGAIALVTKAGFRPQQKVDEMDPPHACAFRDPQDRCIDLHWRVFGENARTVSDDAFWDAAVPIEIEGTPARAFSPPDQLLHVCAHGAAWNPVPSIRWVADAMMILSSAAAPAVEWDRVLWQARFRRLTLPVRDTLGYLKAVFDAPIPDSVLERLHRERTSVAERIAYASVTRRFALRGPLMLLSDLYRQHCAYLPAEAGILRKLLGFPRFLQQAWRMDHVWQLPAVAMTRYRSTLARRRGPKSGLTS